MRATPGQTVPVRHIDPLSHPTRPGQIVDPKTYDPVTCDPESRGSNCDGCIAVVVLDTTNFGHTSEHVGHTHGDAHNGLRLNISISHFRPHSQRLLWCGLYYRRTSVVCLSVCLSATTVSPANTTERVEMPFRTWTQVMDPTNCVLDGSLDPPLEGLLLRGNDVGIFPACCRPAFRLAGRRSNRVSH